MGDPPSSGAAKVTVTVVGVVVAVMSVNTAGADCGVTGVLATDSAESPASLLACTVNV